MAASLKLGKIFGIPFGVNYSWFLIFGVLTVLLSVSYFPAEFVGWHPAAYALIGLVTSLLFFASVVVHELAHSAVSIATGTPVRGITLFVFGGVAQLEREPGRPRDEFFMALAGPVASFLLAVAFWAIFFAFQYLAPPLASLSGWLAMINLSLAIFNLIPGFPLDGGRVFRSVIWWSNGNFLRATQIACIAGRISGYLFILGGLLFIFQGQLLNGIWISFVGWFIDSAASSSYRQAMMRHSLEGLTARDLIVDDFPLVAPAVLVSELVEQYFLRSTHRTYLVAEGGEPMGLISPQSIKRVPRGRWNVTNVGEAMVPLERLKKALVSDNAASLLDRMDEFNLTQLPVEDEGRIVGVIRKDSLLQLIRTRSELGA